MYSIDIFPWPHIVGFDLILRQLRGNHWFGTLSSGYVVLVSSEGMSICKSYTVILIWQGLRYLVWYPLCLWLKLNPFNTEPMTKIAVKMSIMRVVKFMSSLGNYFIMSSLGNYFMS